MQLHNVQHLWVSQGPGTMRRWRWWAFYGPAIRGRGWERWVGVVVCALFCEAFVVAVASCSISLSSPCLSSWCICISLLATGLGVPVCVCQQFARTFNDLFMGHLVGCPFLEKEELNFKKPFTFIPAFACNQLLEI